MPQRIVDACCLINLYASGSHLGILRALEGGLFVSDLVWSEMLFVRQEDELDETILVPEALDLASAFAEGLLRKCQLDSEIEAEHFVRFAAILDDGEAVCLALAKCRNWVVATDDSKAIRVATAGNIATITTAQIVKHWADSSRAEDATVATILRRIERYARFRPRRGLPLYEWWARLCPTSGE